MSDTGRRDSKSGKVFGGKADKTKSPIAKKEPAKTAAESTAAYEAKQREAAAKKESADSTARYEAKRKAAADAAARPNLAVDGEFGPATVTALQKFLAVTQDGAFGYDTAYALQNYLGGIAVDGDFGVGSITRLQEHLRVTADGVMGPQTVSALQERLNAGSL